MATQKVVHLHFKDSFDSANAKSDYFFGSVKAIYDYLPEELIGIKYKSLVNAIRERGEDFYENKHCTIRVGVLQTKKQINKRQ